MLCIVEATSVERVEISAPSTVTLDAAGKGSGSDIIEMDKGRRTMGGGCEGRSGGDRRSIDKA